MFTIDQKELNLEQVKAVLRLLKLEGVLFHAKRQNLCGFKIDKNGEKYEISYGEPCDLFRALTEIALNGVDHLERKRKFKKLGYMVDVARNAVPKISTLKKLALNLAVMGYNRVYIYLEDLFEVDGEPFFGYLRGRYTEAELIELDEYCAGLGIELVPCIQTLAHLNSIFKWEEYAACRDTGDILLVGSERTHALIENMLKTVSRVFRSKTLHIGMDEAHLVGRGKYLDQNGYKTGYEVMAEHIAKVAELAKPYGFELMIWSDMYFRLAFGGDYYSKTECLPKEIGAQIPKNITLTYWDYFNLDGEMLSHMMEEHLKTGRKMSFAGGAWKWTGWNPSTEMSLLTAKAALNVCKSYGVQDVMLTAWADDGAEASIFSTLPVMAYYAENCYGEGIDEKRVDLLLKRVFGLSMEQFYAADMTLIDKEQFKDNYLLGKLPKILLYNDPLSGVYDGIIEKYDVEREIKGCLKGLNEARKTAPEEFRYIFETIEGLCKVLDLKAKLGVEIRKAYKFGDRVRLAQIAEKVIPALRRRITLFEKSFFAQWTQENKDNGYQTHDLRLGGLVKRLQTVQTLLNDYAQGKIDVIYELEDELLRIDGEAELGMLLWKDWNYIHSVYVV